MSQTNNYENISEIINNYLENRLEMSIDAFDYLPHELDEETSNRYYDALATLEDAEIIIQKAVEEFEEIIEKSQVEA